MLISRISEDILCSLNDLFPIEKGECYSNSGVAAVCASEDNEYSRKIKIHKLFIRYALGFLSPPGYETIPHSWLIITKDNNFTFLSDVTLQLHSPLWNKNSDAFRYEIKHILTADEIRIFFRKSYPNREFRSDGIPNGKCRFPIINQAGIIEWFHIQNMDEGSLVTPAGAYAPTIRRLCFSYHVVHAIAFLRFGSNLALKPIRILRAAYLVR